MDHLVPTSALNYTYFFITALPVTAITSSIASCQVRGMGTDGRAKFVTDLWSHPDTLRACSEAAGMDLVPIMPYEVLFSPSAISIRLRLRIHHNSSSDTPTFKLRTEG